jgi:predicted peptidase
MIIAGILNPIMSQSNHGVDIKYSVIKPDDYQPVGKSYPLIVCYQNQHTDSLFQHFARHTQSIMLQLDNTPGITWNPDSLKAVIQRDHVCILSCKR